MDNPMNDPLVAIKDLSKMAKHLAKDIAKNKAIPLSELSEYIKPKEVKSIIRQYSVHKKNKFMINAIILQKIFQEVNNWVIGIELSKLASKDLIESYWSDEENCMTFSVKEQENG
jgi:hypothetical protein